MSSKRAVPDIEKFQKDVWSHWREHGRHYLPWRTTNDAYAILVSEVMLQQTQVDRVIPYFERWMRRFPTPVLLAAASLPDVLQEWQGLGYNRRAKMLRECAKEIVTSHGGNIPRALSALVSLPSIGSYTAGAIRAFAFNEPEVFIETNIRAALLHHFFPRSKRVPDSKLLPILKLCILSMHNKAVKERFSSREWYAALMDYGAHIKKTNPNPSRRSKHHLRQSKFEGSARQLRGHLLRRLLKRPLSHAVLVREQTKSTYRIEKVLRAMEKEGLIIKAARHWRLAD